MIKMKVILLFFYATFVMGRTTRKQWKNAEEEPFTVTSDIFSDQFVVREEVPVPQTFSEDDFEGELLKEQGIPKPKFTGSLVLPLTVTVVNPPGVKPQWPGIKDDPTKKKPYSKLEKVLNISTGSKSDKPVEHSSTTAEAKIDFLTEKKDIEDKDTPFPTLEPSLFSSLSSTSRFATISVATDTEGLMNKTNLDKANLSHSFVESSGEAPINNLLMTELPNDSFITNTTELFSNNESTSSVIDGSGDSDEMPTNFGRIIEKVSGEIGSDKECRGTMGSGDILEKVEPSSDKPTISVEASLETSDGNIQNKKHFVKETMLHALQRTDSKSGTISDSINVLGIINSNSTIEEDSSMLKTHSLEIIVPILLNSKENRTQARRGAVEGCPTPKPCAHNCFIFINEHGCQDCQCLWQAIACESDSDCPESLQLCDLGKCNCRLGYRQDMRQSGICEFDPDYTGSRDGEISVDLSLRSLGVHAGELSTAEAAKAITDDDILDEKEELKWNQRKKGRGETDGLMPENVTNSLMKYFGRHRVVRSTQNSAELHTVERVNWPGPCSSADTRASNLNCLHGDYWYLPEKPTRYRKHNSIPDSFVISNDNDIPFPPTSTLPFVSTDSLRTLKQRGLARFVFLDTIPAITDTEFSRTTVPTSHGVEESSTTSIIEMSIQKWNSSEFNAIDKRETMLNPISEAVATDIVGSSLSNLNDLPPAPPNENSLESVSRMNINRAVSPLHPFFSSSPFIKMIELPHENGFKSTSKRKWSNTKTNQQMLVLPTDSVDAREFPISANLQMLQRAGHSVSPPKALSVKPTKEERDSHIQFLNDLLPLSSHLTSTSQPVNPTASYEINHLPGVWYPMNEVTYTENPRNIRRSPQHFPQGFSIGKIYLEYTKKNIRNKPVVVETSNAKAILHNECIIDRDCGNRLLCCEKKWCDLTSDCGSARFCLPSCELSKRIHLTEDSTDITQIDIIYD